MELFLNLVWLSVSFLLITFWVRSLVHGHRRFQWNIVIALALLLVLLFPVISMTDDLVALSAPVEVEHMLRRNEAPLTNASSIELLDAVALVSLAIVGMASFISDSSRVAPHSSSATLLAGFVRAVGVRPPPAASCTA